ncbi:hypothetical protein G6F32_016090 [Rhizopus arrhizus]|nr:hypothetical protein G6F32_016090 [Rhizopus arrhizus]
MRQGRGPGLGRPLPGTVPSPIAAYSHAFGRASNHAAVTTSNSNGNHPSWLAPRAITSNGYHSWASLNVPPCCSTACSCCRWRGASSPASHSAAIQVSSAGLADNASDRAAGADATAARPSR